MKLAIFGGSFDPPHLGHLAFARFALHWSRVVRTIFFHLGVVKVIHYRPPAAAHTSASPSRLSALASRYVITSPPVKFRLVCGNMWTLAQA